MKYITFIFIICLLYSCDRQVFPYIADVSPTLVTNCVLNPDSTIKVWLSYSKEAIDPTPYGTYLDIKQVELIQLGSNSTTYTMEEQENGLYTLPFRPEFNTTYSLRIEKNNEELPVTANTFIRDSLQVELLDSTISDQVGFDLFKVNFKIYDDSINSNFYIVEIFRRQESFLTEEVFFAPISISGFDPISDNILESDFDLTYSKMYLQSWRFSGSTHNTFVEFPITGFNETIIVRILKPKLEYYRYLKSYDEYLSAVNNSDLDLPEVYTNMSEGYGIFSSCHIKEFRFKFE